MPKNVACKLRLVIIHVCGDLHKSSRESGAKTMQTAYANKTFHLYTQNTSVYYFSEEKTSKKSSKITLFYSYQLKWLKLSALMWYTILILFTTCVLMKDRCLSPTLHSFLGIFFCCFHQSNSFDGGKGNSYFNERSAFVATVDSLLSTYNLHNIAIAGLRQWQASGYLMWKAILLSLDHCLAFVYPRRDPGAAAVLGKLLLKYSLSNCKLLS